MAKTERAIDAYCRRHKCCWDIDDIARAGGCPVCVSDWCAEQRVLASHMYELTVSDALSRAAELLTETGWPRPQIEYYPA